MKNVTFNLFSKEVLLILMYPLIPNYAQCLPSLGSASNFTIFTAAGALSNVTASTIDGNIGTNAGTITGFESSTISGAIYNANAVTQAATTDLNAAYNAFQNLPATFTTHAPAFGGGETILPGVYAIGTAGSIAGTLIMDGQNNPSSKFIMKFGGAFTSGANSNLVLINGALPNNIYWIAEGAFSLAANCIFKGTIISNGAISIGVGNQLNCKLLAKTGAISTYGTQLSISGIDNSLPLYYADADLDSYGDDATSSCDMLAGYVLNHTDCDDTNAAIHPNAIEIYGNGIDENCNGIVDTDTSICGETTIWNGTSWSNGTPSYGKSVIFSASYTTTLDLYACSIGVTNNATLTLNNNAFLFSGLSLDTGCFVIQNNNNNFIQIDPDALNIGDLLVHRNTSTLVRLDHTLWSSPVTGQNIYAFSPFTLPYRFYTYDTPTNTYLSSTLSSSSEFSAAQGYAIRAANNQSSTVPAEWTGSFNGIPNNGTKPVSVIQTATNSYNLIGNPYPSTIDAATFVSNNSAIIEGTLYFYEHTLSMNSSGIFPTGTNYASWNATGATAATEVAMSDPAYHTPAETPNGIIQVGQGFFVEAKTNGVVQFLNTQRLNDENHQFLKTTTTESHHVWLNLISDSDKDINQILVGYVAGATTGIDSNFDGKSYGNKGSYLYSILSGAEYVIQGRAVPFDVNDEVPLGWNCETAGSYSIKLSHWDGIFMGAQDIYIRDNLTGITTSIKTNPYTFTSASGTFTNRFTLVYLPNLAVNNYDLNPENVIVYKTNGVFHIATEGTIIKDVFVYDLLGRLVNQYKDINQSSTILNEMDTTNHVLLIKIVSQDLQTITVKAVN